ncbi:DNA repair protein Dds20/Mei5 [Colletotrichum orchidophilum]|uniref:DNA repair protein Dds20/Mei5 n=1 Tax=Colletotrichum orchidophilum TaxID=1209926 RepID=A0A1G4AX19_9PEZI|nr:DNA repair protein Dds20/Mei5 [Colletotrichum orchidophilum]OHE93684.1 DNA repair protein Dds20/Mei5 [Colletotrichum orchidophilum]
MFTPAAKRRRIDAANETLRKPFKSPLVRDRGQDPDQDGAADPAAEGETTAPAAAPAAATAATASLSSASGLAASTPRKATRKAPSAKQAVSTPTRRPFSVPRPQVPQTGALASPSLLRMTAASYGLKKGGATVAGLGGGGGGSRSEREAEGREEILRQAGRIRGGGVGEGETDEELVGLIGKWRAASRIAAEEVFEGSRERVEGMGGLRAWRRAQREDEVRFMEGEACGKVRRQGEEWEEGDERRGRGEGGGGGEYEGEGEVEEEEDEEFTMGTMLKSMNIDFDIIGYDEDTGWWRDG